MPDDDRGGLGRRLPQQHLPHRRRALAAQGTPHRLLAGPWAHADADHRDARAADRLRRRAGRLVRPLAARGGRRTRTAATSSSAPRRDPSPTSTCTRGYWLRLPSVPPTSPRRRRAGRAARAAACIADVGTAAWIDCAGHLPWGLSGDQRLDDARSLTWDVAPPAGPVVGHPVARLRVSASAPCGVALGEALRRLPRRHLGPGLPRLPRPGLPVVGVHGQPEPLVPGEVYDVEVVLDACAYEWAPGQVLRVSVAGADWPNTVAPPAPVTLTVHSGRGRAARARGLVAGADVRPGRRALDRVRRGRRLGDPRRRAAPAPRRRAPCRSRSTTRRTTAARWRTTAAR